MKKSTHPLMQLLVMLAIMLGMFLLAAVFSAVVMLSGGDVMSGSTLLWTQALTQLLTFALPVVIMMAIYYKGRTREFYRLDFGGRRWTLALAGVVVVLLLLPAIEWLTEWNDTWELGRLGEMMRAMQDQTEGIVEQMLSTNTVGGLLANLLVVALVPAVCEELFFRCGVQNLLQRWMSADGRRAWGIHAAIWCTAIIFSLAHGEIFSFMPRLLLGALLGYLYVYGASVLPNMLVHFTNNAIVVVLYWLVARGVLDIDPEAPIDFGWLTIALCTLAAVAVMWVTFFRKNEKKD